MSWPTTWGPAPRWATPRNYERATFGPLVGRRCRKLTGHPLHPWQQYVLDVALEVDPGGGWAYDEVLETVPRQSGKTFKFAPLVEHRMSREPGRQSFITAQSGDKAVARWSSASDVIASALKDVRKLTSVGRERTLWPNGSAFRPFTPREAAVDGETPDLVMVDELWAFDDAQREAMENSFGPAVFMNPWGQLWKASTAGTEKSAWLNADRVRGRRSVESGGGRMAFFEWSIPEQVGGEPVADLDDVALVELVLAHHPLTGRHPKLTVKALLDELGKGRATFIRGYGNLTQESRAEGLVDAEVWEKRAASALIPDGVRVGLGFDVDELGRESTIYAAFRDPETGVAVVELIEQSAGQSWVPRRLKDLTEKWDVGATAVAYSGPSRSAADAAERAGVELLKVYAQDVSAATTRFLDEIDGGRQLHDGRRGPELTRAMQAATRRQLKAGPMIEPQGSEPVTAIRAAVLAMWATDHLPAIVARVPFMIL